MKIGQQEYYFSRSKINSLYSPDNKYKSFSHYSDKSLVQNLDIQIQINQIKQDIQFLKGKINYEKNQLQQLYLLNCDAKFSYTSIPISKLDPESYFMKQTIVNLKEELKQLEIEERNIQNQNYQKIDQNEEYAFKNYTKFVMQSKSINQLQQHKYQLVERIKQLRHEIYIDQIEINVQDKNIIFLDKKIKSSKNKLQHITDQLTNIKQKYNIIEQQDMKKSKHIKEFISKLGVTNQKTDDMNLLIQNYNRKIANNQKTIDEFVLIGQQRSYKILTQIQDLEYEIQQQQLVKQQLFQQIRELKLKITKFTKSSHTSLENNYQKDNLLNEEIQVEWLQNTNELEESILVQQDIPEDL